MVCGNFKKNLILEKIKYKEIVIINLKADEVIGYALYWGIINLMIIWPNVKLPNKIKMIIGINIEVCINSFFLEKAVCPNKKEKQIKNKPIATATKTKKISTSSITKIGEFRKFIKKYWESQFSLSIGGW